MPSSIIKHLTFQDVFEKLKEVSELNHSRTEKLYIEMHAEALQDLLVDPDLDSYISYSRPSIVDREVIERLLGARIFTHEDSSKRFVLTVTYRTDVLLGDSNA